ncbi:TPA: hypothetical protein SMO99_002939 [Proteus mirabilis]|uniref:Uncharacterized protein n=1 Tax=Morganella morganii TaxID=582 RepID=A0AAI9HW32_MORMO|nr:MULTISPECIES: hypothetical protein [Providencia]EKW8762735.1 hypothetical protein [Morganella morganii]HEJ9425149.1 hypothetical protein [Proteus mirabilis]WOB88698.1 hypothetical protein P3L40_22525 [Providencia sp. PROV040]HEJ9454344.1 hypothetical protein [Proteus mirabilis]HEJ9465728.1 hypothetical protein [Proteus mirabilis]
MTAGIAWYYFGVQPGLVLFPVIGLAIFGILSSIYKYSGVLLMTVFIACTGMTFFVLNS